MAAGGSHAGRGTRLRFVDCITLRAISIGAGKEA